MTVTPLTSHLSSDRLEAEVAANLDRSFERGDAIFAATDTLAIASLARLKALGIAVPDQVRIVGFDDLPLAAQTTPPLTTVRQDIRAGAFAMVDLLIRRISGEDTESIVMPPRLVVRRTA